MPGEVTQRSRRDDFPSTLIGMATARRAWGSIRALASGRFRARYKGPDDEWHNAPVTFRTKKEAGQWLDGEAARVAAHE